MNYECTYLISGVSSYECRYLISDVSSCFLSKTDINGSDSIYAPFDYYAFNTLSKH